MAEEQKNIDEKKEYVQEIKDVEEKIKEKNMGKTSVIEIEKHKTVGTPANIPDKLEKISDEKIRGRIVVFNPEESEFAKNLKIEKRGDYVEKK